MARRRNKKGSHDEVLQKLTDPLLREQAEAERKSKLQTMCGEWAECEHKPGQTERVECFRISASAGGTSEELHLAEDEDSVRREGGPSHGALRLRGEEATGRLTTADGQPLGYITLRALDRDRLLSTS